MRALQGARGLRRLGVDWLLAVGWLFLFLEGHDCKIEGIWSVGKRRYVVRGFLWPVVFKRLDIMSPRVLHRCWHWFVEQLMLHLHFGSTIENSNALCVTAIAYTIH